MSTATSTPARDVTRPLSENKHLLKWVEKMATTLYDTTRAQSPVFWNIVEADAVKKGDSFEVGDPAYVTGGEAWG